MESFLNVQKYLMSIKDFQEIDQSMCYTTYACGKLITSKGLSVDLNLLTQTRYSSSLANER